MTNQLETDDEYPVEFLYREVLSKDHLLEALSFFLVRVPRRDAEEDRPAREPFNIFPRFHQNRVVREESRDVLSHSTATGLVGGKYLIQHSAGSGKIP